MCVARGNVLAYRRNFHILKFLQRRDQHLVFCSSIFFFFFFLMLSYAYAFLNLIFPTCDNCWIQWIIIIWRVFLVAAGNLIIDDVQMEDEGTYICRADNQAGHPLAHVTSVEVLGKPTCEIRCHFCEIFAPFSLRTRLSNGGCGSGRNAIFEEQY